MLVYRIEHPEDGLGPYRSSYSYTKKLLKMNTKHNCSNFHLHSSLDVYDKPTLIGNSIGIHGFNNVENLKFWFKGYRKEMAREGFKMFVYDSQVETTWVSAITGQVIFLKENSDLLLTKEIP